MRIKSNTAEMDRQQKLRDLELAIRQMDAMIQSELKKDPSYLDKVNWNADLQPSGQLIDQEAFKIAAIKYRTPYFRYLYTGDRRAYENSLKTSANKKKVSL